MTDIAHKCLRGKGLWMDRILRKIDRNKGRIKRITSRRIYKNPKEVDVLEYIGVKKVEEVEKKEEVEEEG